MTPDGLRMGPGGGAQEWTVAHWGDLNHPGLDREAVSPDVDLGPERPAGHFDGGHEEEDEIT